MLSLFDVVLLMFDVVLLMFNVVLSLLDVVLLSFDVWFVAISKVELLCVTFVRLAGFSWVLVS